MSGRTLVGLLLILVGLLAIAVGAIYLSQPAHSIPSFFPGYGAHIRGKYVHRGEAGIALGIVLVIIGGAVTLFSRSRSVARW